MAQGVRDIRRRIRAVRNTQQITKAMQMVAAAKLRKAQIAAVSARAYSGKLEELLGRLAADGAQRGQVLLTARPVTRLTLLVVTADRGLAGSYNANLFRRVEAVLARPGGDERRPVVDIVVVGRKGRDYFRRRGHRPTREEIQVPDDQLSELARDLGAGLTESFTRGASDEVLVIYSKFASALQQRPEEMRLLPVTPPEATATQGLAPEVAGGGAGATEARGTYIYEPDARTAYALLVPKFVTNQLFHAFLEARASEHAARMAAMAVATDNAEELVERLTLEMHHARQTSITREIMELVGGAEALRES